MKPPSLRADTSAGSTTLPLAPLPEWAYLPGRSPRHPDGRFDALRATAAEAPTLAALAHSAALDAGLRFLDAGFNWEAHELLEAVWLACPANSAEKRAVQALIQLANARLKLALDLPQAAARISARARGQLIGLDPQQPPLGLDLRALDQALQAIQNPSRR